MIMALFVSLLELDNALLATSVFNFCLTNSLLTLYQKRFSLYWAYIWRGNVGKSIAAKD